MKVFGVGLQKTGTKTLGACLRELGYRHRSFDGELVEAYVRGERRLILEQLKHHDAFGDYPWLLLYREFDRIHPDAKFILTVRRNEEIWFDSLRRYSEQIGPAVTRELMFGHDMPHGHRGEFVEKYLSRNQEIRDYFKNRPRKLLEICWENGDSWDELCSFLGRQSPQIPLPHENKTKSWRQRKLRLIKRRVRERHAGLGALYRRLKASR